MKSHVRLLYIVAVAALLAGGFALRHQNNAMALQLNTTEGAP